MCIAVYYITTVAFISLLTYFLSPLSSHLLFSLPSPFILFSSSFSTSSFPLPPLHFLLLLHSTSSLFSSSFSLFSFSSSFSTSFSSFFFFIYHMYRVCGLILNFSSLLCPLNIFCSVYFPFSICRLCSIVLFPQ